jgi:ABC-type glycerol-3-phosphate transport system permease component
MVATLRRRPVRLSIRFVVACLLVALLDLPVITLLLNSLRSSRQILSGAGMLAGPFSPANYAYVLSRTPFVLYLRNSVTVALVAALISTAAAAAAGYALSRRRSRGLTTYSRLLLMSQMFPVILAIIPLFVLFRETHLLDTFVGVILIYVVTTLPFGTWTCRSCFDAIPLELEEAARIDGCGELGAAARIVAPLAAPGIAAVAMFAFLLSYNEFFVASVFLQNESLMTIPVGMQQFITQYSADWGALTAGSALAMIPTLVFFLVAQRRLRFGALAGSLKG